MEITEQVLAGAPLFAIEGELDRSSMPDLEKVVVARLRSGNTRLLLDLAQCSFIDSSGLGLIMSVTEQLHDCGLLGVVGANSSIQRLFEIAGVSGRPSLFMFEDQSQALSYLESLAPPQPC